MDPAETSGGSSQEFSKTEQISQPKSPEIDHGVDSIDATARQKRLGFPDAIKDIKTPIAFSRGKNSTKIENFQVSIKIHKARRLSGSNVKPIVQVKCGDLQPQTTHRKNGCDVAWNETLVFTLRDSMSNVRDYVTEITVLDSQRLRSDCVIGSFKLDLGHVYDQENHSYMRKWLLLTDLDEFESRPKGYLKFSIYVLGAGDVKPFEDQDGASDDDDDEDDVQSNLLMPVGADLRTVLFVLRVYRAEDLPQMDWSLKKQAKNMVDPYVTFSFSGISKSTSTITRNDTPVWNEQLVVPVKVPSFCETLKLELTDYDFPDNDDPIGSVSIPLSSICLPGYGTDEGGFLPNFGPSFINIYSSSKQGHQNNEYRGRVLVELTTVTDEFDYSSLKSRKKIDEQVMYQHEIYMKTKPRSQYCLVVAFEEASMIEKTDNQISFQISMGKYTTSFTSDLELFLSTKDKKGPTYYYVPWGSKKPVIVLKAEWEDIEFRYRTLNAFLKEVAYMEKAIKLIEDQTQESERKQDDEYDDSELAVRIIHVLDEAIEFCRKFPALNPTEIKAANYLDAQLFQSRMKCLDQWKLKIEESRVSCTDVNEAIKVLKDFKNCLKQLSHEPQGSMPDIVVQMQFSKKRVAFARIPAYDVLYSRDSKQFCGKMCGVTSTVCLQYIENSNDYRKRPAVACQLQANFWLGLHTHEVDYVKDFTSSTHASLSVYAETFEERKGLGQQTTFSPLSINDAHLACPIGWRWKDDWKFIRGPLRDRSLHLTQVQEVYEVQTRLKKDWAKNSVYFDENNNEFVGKHEIRCERNWAVKSNWELDLRGQEDGWEYSSFTSYPIWMPQQQPQSLKRRRRWFREIKFVDLQEQVKWEKSERESENGWVKFKDGCVKRRWIRQLEQDSDDANTFTFQFNSQQDLDSSSSSNAVSVTFQPTISMDFNKSMRLQIRAYIYQAKDLLPLSKQGYAKHTPFVYAFFMTQGVRTKKKVMKAIRKLNPCWDQTLQLEMEYYGSMYQLKRRPPHVLIHIYVKNDYGKCAWLGQANVETTLQFETASRAVPVLAWCPIKRGKQDGGAILAAAEIFTIVPGKTIPKETSNVPAEIAPKMAQYSMDLIMLGVRDMKLSTLRRVKKPSIVIAVGDVEIRSDIIKDIDKSPNFQKIHYRKKLSLPDEKKFWPPIVIRMKDHQFFGIHPTIGEHVIHDVSIFMKPTATNQNNNVKSIRKPLHKRQHVTIHIGDASSQTSHRDCIDWWSKYHASKELMKISAGRKSIEDSSEECRRYFSSGLDTLDIFKSELEKQGYGSFNDVIRSFPVYSRRQDVDDSTRHAVGEVKGQICIYKLNNEDDAVTRYHDIDSLDKIIDVKVRVYIVRAYDLAPKDRNGLSDPYILVSAGTKKAGDRSKYQANCLSPVFGQVLELDLVIPLEKTLRIEVYDWDAIGKDDKIGETTIDLENRFHSEHWAWFGLPKTFQIQGLNKWRLQSSPKTLLQMRAKIMNIDPPCWNGKRAVTFNHKTYQLSDFENDLENCTEISPEDERLALYVLREYPHVTEHVETRTLFSNAIPGIPQGKLELWVDMFPKKYGEPGPPEDITPREPKKLVSAQCCVDMYSVY